MCLTVWTLGSACRDVFIPILSCLLWSFRLLSGKFTISSQPQVQTPKRFDTIPHEVAGRSAKISENLGQAGSLFLKLILPPAFHSVVIGSIPYIYICIHIYIYTHPSCKRGSLCWIFVEMRLSCQCAVAWRDVCPRTECMQIVHIHLLGRISAS